MEPAPLLNQIQCFKSNETVKNAIRHLEHQMLTKVL